MGGRNVAGRNPLGASHLGHILIMIARHPWRAKLINIHWGNKIVKNKTDNETIISELSNKGILEIWDKDLLIDSWESFEKIVKKLDLQNAESQSTNWSFRGEGKWEDKIQSSIEKAANQNGIGLDKLYDECIEQGLIRKFKRDFVRIPHFQPVDDDNMAWLAIMQHHGAPTRLVDISYSIYVALYFALWRYEADKEGALWCFNNEWLNNGWNENSSADYKKEYKKDLDRRYTNLFNIVLKSKNPKVYLLNPYNPPERLILQQGGFIIPLDIKKEFMENLSSMPISPKNNKKKKNYLHRVIKIKIKVDKLKLKEIRYQLIRMNINNATLFPGIDGFARNLYDCFPFEVLRAGFKMGFDK
jgi:hypothetical protein